MAKDLKLFMVLHLDLNFLIWNLEDNSIILVIIIHSLMRPMRTLNFFILLTIVFIKIALL